MAGNKAQLYGGKWMVLLMLGPAVVLFCVFMLYPAIDALIISLSSWTGFSPQAEYTGLANYRNLWPDEHFWAGLQHTFFFVVCGGLGHFFFAYLFAFALNNPRLAGKKFYQTLLFFPSFISVVGVAILWGRLYDPRDGLINHLFNAIGIPDVEWLAPGNAMLSIIVASVWAGVGGQMILLLAGMRRIPAEYYEASRLDGASEFQVFRHVTLPLLKDVTYVALSLWLIGSMQIFGLVQALAGPDVRLHMETVSTYQYAVSFNARDNIYMMGRGTAMAVVLVVLIIIMVAILRLLFGKREVEY